MAGREAARSDASGARERPEAGGEDEPIDAEFEVK